MSLCFPGVRVWVCGGVIIRRKSHFMRRYEHFQREINRIRLCKFLANFYCIRGMLFKTKLHNMRSCWTVTQSQIFKFCLLSLCPCAALCNFTFLLKAWCHRVVLTILLGNKDQRKASVAWINYFWIFLRSAALNVFIKILIFYNVFKLFSIRLKRTQFISKPCAAAAELVMRYDSADVLVQPGQDDLSFIIAALNWLQALKLIWNGHLRASLTEVNEWCDNETLMNNPMGDVTLQWEGVSPL